MSTLTSTQIIALLRRDGPSAHGAAQYLQLAGRSGNAPLGGAQGQFLADFIRAQSEHIDRRPSRYRHPGSAARHGRSAGPLTAAELAWIGRLPDDPTKVTFEDARVLAAMSNTIERLKNPADALLVDQAWVPVRAGHDRNAAQARLDEVKVAPPSIPSSTLAALAEALAAENSQLTEDEARLRGQTFLAEVRTARDEAQGKAIEGARAEAEQVAQDESDRTAVTR